MPDVEMGSKASWPAGGPRDAVRASANGNRESELDLISAASAAQRIPGQYDELLAKLTEADRDLDQHDVPGRSSHLEEASAIVFDLLYSLDYRQGGELVPRLAALYGYIASQLLVIGKSRNRTDLLHIRDMIMTLKQSWYGNAA
jgi:flagellar biosynthetic protein FliS